MDTIGTTWRPSWWKEAHFEAWALVRESVRRDWQQTRHDLGLGGEELHQSLGDTLKQACGALPLPVATSPIDVNPPVSLGAWHTLQGPYCYGVGARREFGAHHPRWNPMIEAVLMSEWTAAHDQVTRSWQEVVQFARRGYELRVPPPTTSTRDSRQAQ